MFKNLTYTNKNKLLAAGGVVVLYLLYTVFIADTIELYGQCNAIQEQVNMAVSAPARLKQLEAKRKEVDAVFNAYKSSDTLSDAKQNLLGIVTNYCQQNNSVLREFPQTIHTEDKEFLIETNTFVVEGSFVKLTELIYLLEQKSKTGKIASVQYSSKKDYKTQTLSLMARIYIQNIKKQKHESNS